MLSQWELGDFSCFLYFARETKLIFVIFLYGSYKNTKMDGPASLDTKVMSLSQIYASSFCTLLKACLILIMMTDSDVES